MLLSFAPESLARTSTSLPFARSLSRLKAKGSQRQAPRKGAANKGRSVEAALDPQVIRSKAARMKVIQEVREILGHAKRVPPKRGDSPT